MGNSMEIRIKPFIRFRRGKIEKVREHVRRSSFDEFLKTRKLEVDRNDPNIKLAMNIAKEIKAEGGRALVVGGFVRDKLLGLPSKDIDIEVYGIEPKKLKEILTRKWNVNEVGESFGVLKVKHEGMKEAIDISLPRRDSKIGEGHRGFEIRTDPWMSVKEAAKRRDLTINAMAWDPLTGEVIDEFGGIDDIKNKKLRVVDEQKFGEDPLRVLRVMQFAARFGFTPDLKTVKICRNIDLKALSKERIYGEFEKLLLKAKNPSIGLRLISLLGIDKIVPELVMLKGLPQDPKWHEEGDVGTHTVLAVDAAARLRKWFKGRDKIILMWAALLHDLGKVKTTVEKEGKIVSPGHSSVGAVMAREFLEKLTSEKEILDKVEALVKYHMLPIEMYLSGASDGAIRRLAKKVDIPLLVAVSVADVKGRLGGKASLKPHRWLMEKYKELGLKEKQALEPVIKGRHLIEIGVAPGKEMGKLLDRLYEAQLDGKFKTVSDGIEFAKRSGWIN